MTYSLDRFKDDTKAFIKLAFGVSIIYFMITKGFNFGLGFIYGMAIMSYLFLFPPPAMIPYLDKLFNYSKSTAILMKEYGEQNKNEIEKNKVKFKKA